MSTLPAHGEPIDLPLSAETEEGAAETAELRRELATEKSANAALLSALRALESQLAETRRRVDALEAELTGMEGSEDAELARQRTVTRNLLGQLEEARQALVEEREKSLARRLLGR